MVNGHAGKHLPKATSSLGDPLMRIFRRKIAQSRLRSFARNPSHVSLSAVSRRSGVPSWPSVTRRVLSRMTTVAVRGSLPVNVKWKVAFSPSDCPR